MSTEKDVRELVIVNELSQLLGKAFTIYNKTTGEAYGLDGQAVLNIAAASISKSQSIPNDTGSTTKVPVVAAVESELAKKVSLTGNETVAGIKTFSSSPVVPGPTAAQQVANKKYVDDSIATRQVALTFGIADSNAVKINAADVAVGDYARFTASGLQGRSAAEVISDLGAEAVANKNVAGGYAGLGADAKVLPGLLPDFILGQVRYGGTFVGSGVITSEYASLNGQNIASIEAGDYFGYYFIANAAISVHGLSFQVGDWLISNGTAGWAKVDNTDAVTTVAGRTGAITLTKSDITDFPNKWAWEDLSGVPVTFAPSSHTHEWADLTNPPASYTPSAHVHGNISNDGKIGATADYVVVTGSGGTLTTASRAGIDSRSSFPPADHTHDNRYYTETEINNFFSGSVSVTGYNKSNWDTAHGWGNHASAGYASAATLSSHISDTSSHLSADERTYFNKLKDYLKIAADNTSIYTTINFYSESGVSAFGIGSGGSGGVGVDVIDDLLSARTDAALSANQGRILKGYIDLKQAKLTGTGASSLVRVNASGVVDYDNTPYATVSQLSGYATTSHTHNSFYTKYLYPNNIVQSTTAETLSGNNENFTAMFDAPSIFGSGNYANAFIYTGYNQYGSTQLVTLYNAPNGNNRMAFRVYNQAIGGYNDFTEVWTKDNLLNIGTTALSARTALELTGTVSSHTHTFASLTSKPTTVDGYGISDAIYFNENIDITTNNNYRHYGYGYSGNGWAATGAALTFGASGSYYALIQATPDNIWYNYTFNGAKGSWKSLWHSGNFNPSSYLTTVTAATTYLPLSGGAISSTVANPFSISISGKKIWDIINSEVFLYAEDNSIARWCSYYNYTANQIRFYSKNASGVDSAVNLTIYDGSVYQGVLHAGNYSSYALPVSGGTLTGKVLTASTGEDTYGGALEIRERAYVTTSQTDWSYSPAISFHWGGRYVRRFGLRSDGQLAIDSDNILIHSGNIGSQSVSYATSAGNAAKLKSSATAGVVDLNTFLSGGGSWWNYGQGAIISNQPSWFQCGSVYQLNSAYDSLALQIATTTLHNTTTPTYKIGWRMSNNLGWQNDWKEIYHSGNLTNTLSNGYLPYWNGSSLVNSRFSINGNGTLLMEQRPTYGGFYIGSNQNASGTQPFWLQAGEISSGFGGSLGMYGHSHSTYPGWVIAGISASSGGAFSVQNQALGGGSNLFIVKQNGNVGIGTTNPLARLDVNVTNKANEGIVLSNGGAAYSRWGMVNYGVDNNTYIGSTSNNSFLLISAGAERLRIGASGNIDIGYAGTRTEKFAVAGDAYFRDGVKFSNGGGGPAIIYGSEVDGFLRISNNNIYTGDILFQSENITQFALRGGKVDIGWTTNPNLGYKLAVNGSGYFNGNLGLGASADVRLSVSGDAHISNILYMGGTAGSYASWGSRTLVTAGNYSVGANSFEFNNYGYGTTWGAHFSSSSYTFSNNVNRSTIRQMSSLNIPTDFYMGVGSTDRWSITTRDSYDGYNLKFYSASGIGYAAQFDWSNGIFTSYYGVTAPTITASTALVLNGHTLTIE